MAQTTDKARGAALRYFRELREMRQNELGRVIGAEASAISKKEAGTVRIMPAQLVRLLKALKVSETEWREQVRRETAQIGEQDLQKPTYVGILRPGESRIPLLNRDTAGKVHDYSGGLGMIAHTEKASVDRGLIVEADAVGLVVVGTAMEPRIHAGDMLIIAPRTSASPGQVVVVEVEGAVHIGRWSESGATVAKRLSMCQSVSLLAARVVLFLAVFAGVYVNRIGVHKSTQTCVYTISGEIPR